MKKTAYRAHQARDFEQRVTMHTPPPALSVPMTSCSACTSRIQEPKLFLCSQQSGPLARY